MKKRPFLFSLLTLLLLVAGCRRTDFRAQLNYADSLLAERPDSALRMLAAFESIDELSEEERMHYIWIKANAHFHCYISMSEDTLLPQAVDYYRSRGDVEKELSGYRLKANFLRWKGEYDSAFAELEKGIVIAKKQKDSAGLVKMLGDKASLYYEIRRDYAGAARFTKQAMDYSADTTSFEYVNMVYSLAVNLSLCGKDSGSYYYEKSIALAEANKDTAYLCHYMRNYASSLIRTGKEEDSKRANALIRRVWQISPQYNQYPVTQMIVAENFLNLGKPDSADYYLGIAWHNLMELEKKSGADISGRGIYYTLKSAADLALGKEVSSMPIGRFCDSVKLAEVQRTSTMRQQLETKMRLERNNYQLVIDRQRIQLALMGVVFLLLAGGLSGYFYVRTRRRRLAEAEERIETLTRLLEDADKGGETVLDGAFFKKILLQQLGIIRLVATSPTSQNQELLRRISGISNKEVPVESLLVWEDLYPVIDTIYEGFYTMMKNRYGEILVEKEQQLCCLLCAGFSTKEISVVTQQSVPTIYMRKTAIRKKLGMDEKQDIVAYIKGV